MESNKLSMEETNHSQVFFWKEVPSWHIQGKGRLEPGAEYLETKLKLILFFDRINSVRKVNRPKQSNRTSLASKDFSLVEILRVVQRET